MDSDEEERSVILTEEVHGDPWEQYCSDLGKLKYEVLSTKEEFRDKKTPVMRFLCKRNHENSLRSSTFRKKRLEFAREKIMICNTCEKNYRNKLYMKRLCGRTGHQITSREGRTISYECVKCGGKSSNSVQYFDGDDYPKKCKKCADEELRQK